MSVKRFITRGPRARVRTPFLHPRTPPPVHVRQQISDAVTTFRHERGRVYTPVRQCVCVVKDA